MRHLRRSFILIVLACYAGGTASAQSGALTNGSFESDYTLWTHTGNQSVVAFGAPYATNGIKAVRFNAGQTVPNGVLSQSFATTAGQTYTLTFDEGAVSVVNQDAQRMQVTVQGATTRLSQAVTVTATGVGARFVRQTFTFVADSATTTLRFQDTSLTTMNVDLYLDNVAVTSGSSTALPSPLRAVDIGSPAIVGSTTYQSGVYTIKAGGADIWSTSDQFHYVYQPVTGDVEIVARVSSITAANAWSKLGVMVRETLAANSRHATAFVSAASGYAFQRRIDPGGFSTSSGGVTGAPPAWIRLVRTGSRFEAFRSTTGTTWTSMGFDTIPMGSAVYVGLATTSHATTLATTAKADSLRITPIASTGNKLPSVALTAPVTGATFTPPATIALTATASDPEARLSRVEFFSGATRIGTDSVAPFAMSWLSVPAGTYSLTAKAFDLDGGTATSPVATVSVRSPTTQLPTVALTAPVAGATITAPSTVTVSASASDPEGRMSRVEFFVGTTSIGTDTTSPYSASWSTSAAGGYALKAIAYDLDGGSRTSTIVNVTVIGATTIVPKRVVFGKSADHATTLVTNYQLEVYANGANPVTATPVTSSNLGKPTPLANGDIDVDRATFFAALPVGTYVASVSAVGPGGKSRAAPVTFTR